jgi:hypothetical protein
MTRRGFEINKRGIEQFTRELQQEFDKHPIRMDVRTDLPQLPDIRPGTTTIYNGPVILGSADGAQLAWNNDSVSQSQSEQPQHIAAGFEALAQVVIEVLQQLPAAGLCEEDQVNAAEAGNEILAQLTETVPDAGKVKRALTLLRGVLAPLVVAAGTGVAQGVAEWAKAAIEHLTSLVP